AEDRARRPGEIVVHVQVAELLSGRAERERVAARRLDVRPRRRTDNRVLGDGGPGESEQRSGERERTVHRCGRIGNGACEVASISIPPTGGRGWPKVSP